MSSLSVEEKQSKIAASAEQLQSEVAVALYKFDNGGSLPHSMEDIRNSARWIAESRGLADDDGKVSVEVIDEIIRLSGTA